MKMISYLLVLIFVCISTVTGCRAAVPTETDETSISSINFPEAPLTLVVICGEDAVTAWRGSYSWHILLDNNMGTGKQSDSLHPLAALDSVPVLKIGNSQEVSLVFEVLPGTAVPVQTLEVLRYRIDTNNYDDYETVTLNGTALMLPAEDALYEVIVSWDISDGTHCGTARYAFRTEK